MWLHVPGICCPSATDMEEPNSPSDMWHGYEPYVELRGTVTRRPSSWNGWNRRGWIHALSGMRSKRSTVDHGVAEWISSLPVSHAPISRLPVGGPALTASTGSGPNASRSSATWDRESSCWKTCPGLFGWEDLPESSVTLPTSGSMRNGVVSERPTLEHHTSESAGGVLRWPTPTGKDSVGSGSRQPSYNLSLTDVTVRMWATPVARDDGKTPEAHLEMKARMGGNRTEVTSLQVQAKMWPTPRASWNENRTTKNAPSHGDTHGETLAGAAKDAVAGRWPTPNARDHKGQDKPGRKSSSLPDMVGSGRLDATTATDGSNGSTRVDLNPWFVACLMGLPMDWAIHSACSEMVSSHNAQLQRGASYSIEAGGHSKAQMPLWGETDE